MNIKEAFDNKRVSWSTSVPPVNMLLPSPYMDVVMVMDDDTFRKMPKEDGLLKAFKRVVVVRRPA
jgi:hypothetical protein